MYMYIYYAVASHYYKTLFCENSDVRGFLWSSSHLSPGVSLIYDLAKDSGILQKMNYLQVGLQLNKILDSSAKQRAACAV